MSKLLVDTNLLAYSVDEESAFFERADQLLYHSGYELFTTSKNIAEYLCAMTRIDGAGALPEVLADVQDFKKSITILYPNKGSSTIFEKLLLKYMPAGKRIHDFEIIAIGLANGITQIATVNTKDFKGVEEISIIGL